MKKSAISFQMLAKFSFYLSLLSFSLPLFALPASHSADTAFFLGLRAWTCETKDVDSDDNDYFRMSFYAGIQDEDDQNSESDDSDDSDEIETMVGVLVTDSNHDLVPGIAYRMFSIENEKTDTIQLKLFHEDPKKRYHIFTLERDKGSEDDEYFVTYHEENLPSSASDENDEAGNEKDNENEEDDEDEDDKERWHLTCKGL